MFTRSGASLGPIGGCYLEVTSVRVGVAPPKLSGVGSSFQRRSARHSVRSSHDVRTLGTTIVPSGFVRLHQGKRHPAHEGAVARVNGGGACRTTGLGE